MSITNAKLLTWTGALAPFLAISAPLSMAPLLVLSAVAIVISNLIRKRALPSIPWDGAILTGLFLGWAAVTLLWSIDPERGLRTVFKILLYFSSGLVLARAAARISTEERAIFRKAFLWAMTIAGLILSVEIWFSGPLHNLVLQWQGKTAFETFMLNRPISILAIWLWPLIAGLYFRYGFKVGTGALIVALVVMARGDSSTVIFALGIGAIIYGLHLIDGIAETTRKILTGSMLLTIFLAPALAGVASTTLNWETKSPQVFSLMHRLFIWDFAASRIQDKPFTGWGLESSRHLADGWAPTTPLRSDAGNMEAMVYSFKKQLLPLHPHNASLQIWLETGLPGALLFAGLILLITRRIERLRTEDPARENQIKGILIAQLAVTFAIAGSSYGIWQSWWMSTMWLGAIFAIAIIPTKQDDKT
jgi:O-antigen ligase